MTRAVEDVLEEIGAGDQPRMLVLNKADLLDDERRHELAFRHPDAVARVARSPARGSTSCGSGSPTSSSARCATSSCSCPFSEGGTLSELHDVAGDLERSDTPEGVRVSARLPAVVAERFDRYATDGPLDPESRPRSRSSPRAQLVDPDRRREHGTSRSWAMRSPGRP